jgi:hypothetical protein
MCHHQAWPGDDIVLGTSCGLTRSTLVIGTFDTARMTERLRWS